MRKACSIIDTTKEIDEYSELLVLWSGDVKRENNYGFSGWEARERMIIELIAETLLDINRLSADIKEVSDGSNYKHRVPTIKWWDETVKTLQNIFTKISIIIDSGHCPVYLKNQIRQTIDEIGNCVSHGEVILIYGNYLLDERNQNLLEILKNKLAPSVEMLDGEISNIASRYID